MKFLHRWVVSEGFNLRGTGAAGLPAARSQGFIFQGLWGGGGGGGVHDFRVLGLRFFGFGGLLGLSVQDFATHSPKPIQNRKPANFC